MKLSLFFMIMQFRIIILSFLISSDKHNNDKTPIAEGLIISNYSSYSIE